MKELSYSGRFIRPFVALLLQDGGLSANRRERLRGLVDQERIPVEAAHASLGRWVQRAADPDMGVKAGARVRLGWGGALEYAMHSAPTVRASTEVASRFVRLFSDALALKVEPYQNRVLLHMDSRVPWPRVVADFTISAWYNNHIRHELPDRAVECWFAHERPANVAAYEGAFASARLRFNASTYGFVFDVDDFEAPLRSGDAALHAVHCEHARILYEALPERRDLATTVREVATKQFALLRPTAHSIARQLHMSRRTLARRLDDEGTTFANVMDDLRRGLALRYIECHELPLSEITNLLGFSHQQAFHRAFRRWTGQAPGQYRKPRA